MTRVAGYPVVKVTRPADLACANNGELQDSLTASIGDSNSRVHHQAAVAWSAMWMAAQEDGWSLTWTYGGLYRTLAMQRDLFFRRWSATHLEGRPTVWYAGNQWWLKRGVARAAVPGSSTHGWGLAVDIALGEHPSTAAPITPALQWLLANATDFGWCWESQAEPWHLNYFEGDVLPPRVG